MTINTIQDFNLQPHAIAIATVTRTAAASTTPWSVSSAAGAATAPLFDQASGLSASNGPGAGAPVSRH